MASRYEAQARELIAENTRLDAELDKMRHCTACRRDCASPPTSPVQWLLFIARGQTCGGCWERLGGVALSISLPDELERVRKVLTDHHHSYAAAKLKLDTVPVRRRRLNQRLRTANKNAQQWSDRAHAIALALSDLEAI